MHVTFKDASNYYTKMLAFEVVDFSGLYHIILGWPCYVKFMTIPNLHLPQDQNTKTSWRYHHGG
jgi:hypothetical protein